MRKSHKLAIFASLCSGLIASDGLAAGYSSSLTATSGLANSYAGSVTGSHDASDLFYNPAASSHFDKNQAIVSVSYLSLKIDPDNVKAASKSGSKFSGAEESNAGANLFVPAIYLSHALNDKTSLGFAVNSPFGLRTNYGNDWTGRYTLTDSQIKTINFNPSVSHKLTDDLAIGAGVSAQYYQATFSAAVPRGGNQYKAKGSDWGYGFNLGATYKINEDLRFGIGYRSKIDHHLQGTAQVLNNGTTTLSSGFTTSTATPESVTIGANYQFSKDLELVYDATWTRWSRVNNYKIGADNSALNNNVAFKMHDSYMNSVGANYKLNSDLLLRSGLAYEKDGVTNANRQPSVPNGSKYWTSIGLNYKISDGYSVDATYMHQFFRAATSNIVDASGNSFSAKYKNRVDVISLALKKEF